MKDIRIGFIGLGGRGYGLMTSIILAMGEKVVAVCDAYLDKAEKAAQAVVDAGQERPAVYIDYRDAIADKNVNTVIIATAWEDHSRIAIAALKAGKAVGLEVGGAHTLQQCFDLVSAYEETRAPFMFLENCCFGRREMMVLDMVKKGLFGEIVHCSGGYHHELPDEIINGRELRHYRLRNYMARNCENYPTHEIGPIARVLDINHGNRMMTLTSMASKSAALHEYVMKEKPNDELLVNTQFAQGDIVTTTIKCARGETIVLTLDTTLPRFYYSRGFTVRGTKGLYEEVTDSVFLNAPEEAEKVGRGNAEKYAEDYEHPVWTDYIKRGVKGTHDGMDWLEFEIFFDCLKNDKPMPIDVYDAASWMSISVLSEMSIARGGALVDVPDFTQGKWYANILG